MGCNDVISESGTVFKGKMQPQIAGLETRDFGRLNLEGKDFHHV